MTPPNRPSVPPRRPDPGLALLFLAVGALAMGSLTAPEGALAQAGPGSGDAPGQVAARNADTPDLRNLLAPGFLVEDRNADGHPDFVSARLVVPRGAGAAEVAAAANLGARLAFESYATDLDLLREDGAGVGGDGAPLVVVGRAEAILGAVGVDPVASLAELAPGEGVVIRLPASAALPGGGVWVAGGDATGLLAGADYLAGRYPGVWTPDGPTWDELSERIGSHLSEATPEGVGEGIPLSLDRAVVSAARPGVVRAALTLRVEEARAWDPIREALDPQGRGRELLVPGIHRLDVHLVGTEGREARLRIAPERPWSEGELPAWQPREVPDFTLSDLFTTRGIYRDSSQDLLPDRIEAWISLRDGAGAEGAVDLAMRVAHEATGVRFPLVRPAAEDDPPEAHGFPILFGVDHFTTARLREEGRLGTPLEEAGMGFVELVTEAVGERPALVVGGEDADGLAAAARLVAHRFPHLHTHERGAFGLRDVEEEVRRFFQARGAAGQTALALVKLEEWLGRLEAGERPGVPPTDQAHPSDPEAPGWRPATPLRALQVELAVDTVPAGLEAQVRRRVEARFPGVPVELTLLPSAFGAGEEVFSVERTFPWEVEEAWAALREEVLPQVGPGTRGRIELRVSEPPEIRRELAAALRDSVAARGGDPALLEVSVLNAYKQGFSWIQDRIIPRLLEGPSPLPVARVEIDYHHLQEDDELPWKAIGSDTRWLQELFPVEEILARELGIPDTATVFRGVRSPGQTYTLRALDAAGAVLFEEGFEARYRILPYFHLFPDYERVRVPTGWLHAEVEGEVVADRRIATDLDRFWAFWQEEIHPALRDHVMELHEGRVTPATAPFFDELRVEVRLSEPNHRMGVDEEVVSSLESLHNDLYFTSLAFFSHLGQHLNVGSLNFPGRILPFIDPTGDGEEGWARVTLTGRSRASAELTLRVEADPVAGGGETSGRWRYALDPLPTEAPKLRGAAVAADGTLRRLLFDVTAVDSVPRFREFRDQAPEGTVDRTFLSVEMLAGMVEVVRALHGEGLLERTLAFRGVEELAFRFGVERAEEFNRTVSLPVSGSPHPAERPTLTAEAGFRWEEARRAAEAGGPSLVQWETPIPPPESDALLALLDAFPEAEAYHVGRSFLGKDLWAADFLPPVEAAFRSRARLTALKPTVFLSGRQHANEVSSTSHLLRLGERLVTDPEYRALLDRVNVVLNPILNADGAQLAYDMQLVNPDFTLHAGYLGALGMDVTAGSGSDPLYPESRVRPELFGAWLPDAYLNLHGYPSHEWVQHFSGYAAWVRGRTVAQRSWWAPRGWFIPGYAWVDDPDHPEIREAQFAILDTLAHSITSLPDVEAMNRRQYGRYARYGRQDVEGFREGFHEGMLVYLALRGREATGDGPENPRILTFSATTEAPDETARGEWLELVAGAGLAHTSALIRYMATGDPRVERSAEAFRDAVVRSVARTRPVLPEGHGEAEEREGG